MWPPLRSGSDGKGYRCQGFELFRREGDAALRVRRIPDFVESCWDGAVAADVERDGDGAVGYRVALVEARCCGHCRNGLVFVGRGGNPVAYIVDDYC